MQQDSMSWLSQSLLRTSMERRKGKRNHLDPNTSLTTTRHRQHLLNSTSTPPPPSLPPWNREQIRRFLRFNLKPTKWWVLRHEIEKWKERKWFLRLGLWDLKPKMMALSSAMKSKNEKQIRFWFEIGFYFWEFF